MAVKITKDYAPVVSSGARSGIKMSKCIGVTIHNTDNDGAGANAKAHANLLKNTWKNKQQSWHLNRPLSSRQVKKEKLRHEGLVPVSKGSQAL